MKVLVYGTKADGDEIINMLKSSGKSYFYVQTNDTDTFLEELVKNPPNLIIITDNGASGMEHTITAKKVCPDTPLFWFSDDKDFGAQAYRLNCTYFSAKPVTKQKLLSAVKRI